MDSRKEQEAAFTDLEDSEKDLAVAEISGQDGSDVTAEIDVTFDEAAFGGDKVIRLSDAQGSNVAGKSLKVHIPAGISDGKSIRLRGKGMPGVSREVKQEICY